LPNAPQCSTRYIYTEHALKAFRDFGLQRNFRGIVFGGISAHWLDDGFMGADIVNLESRAAVSFHEGVSAAHLHASMPLSMPRSIHRTEPVISSCSKRELTSNCPWRGAKSETAALLSSGYQGQRESLRLGRKANISLTSITVIDAGAPREEYGVDISIVVSDKSELARFAKDDLSLSQKIFNYLASVLALSPVFKLASGRISAPPNADGKGVSFVEVGAGSILGGFLATAALGTSRFFKEALQASELRVTGARILSQSTGDGNKRDTAILFDVETEFGVENNKEPP